MKKITLKAATLALAGGLTFAAPVNAADKNVMIVFDGSNSMWGQIDGTAKIEIARDVMENLLGEWTETRKVGLMAYGHRRRGDCSDMETIVVPGEGTRTEILDRIGAITPTGKTPLTSAVEQAATELSYTDTPATVVLISDGLESCERDPCALAETLEKGGVGFTTHVVGFGLGDADTAALSCLAEKTGGQYISASNAEELGRALSTVGTAVAEPEPEPEPELPEVTVTGPETALAGSLVRVGWDKALDKRDYVTIVPTGTELGEYDNYIRVKDRTEGDLRAPADTGMYELRYMTSEDGKVLGTAMIEITEPEVTVSGPDTALAGERFPVEWTGTIDGQDYVTIVAMGAEEGSHANYVRVSDKSAEMLQAPAETGLYELRYVLKEGRRTMARQPIEITEPEVTVSGPDTALAGERFPVEWTGTIDGQDYVTIVAMGAEEGSHANYVRVSDKSAEMLQAPAETGLYELRYVLKEGRRTMARQPIEITEPEVTVSGPDTALAGERFPVEWTGTVDGQDYVTIVAMGAEEGSHANYVRVSDKSAEMLQAPAETGLYELRYVLKEGRRTMARQPIEIIEPEVTVSGPDEIRANSEITVEWTGTVDDQDYITIVARGAEEGSHAKYFRVRDKSKEKLQAPADPGLYELRYILKEGRRTMARHAIEVLAADAALESGASLSAPETAAPGAVIDVGWNVNSASADQRITLARGNQAIFTWLEAVRISGEPPVQITLPEEPGIYELRFLDVANQAVLSRKVIAVE
ncbi:vWA domain-containing protein [Qingshengfaniella alkalisoli]|nr:VWA domain-containing protein [Qingshengfaniella alkalisoli]